jgi:hypothetical protein
MSNSQRFFSSLKLLIKNILLAFCNQLISPCSKNGVIVTNQTVANQIFLTCILFYRCKCGHCVITHIQNTHEAWCCQEMESCRKVLKDDLVLEDVPQPPCCITLHPGFRPICLEKWALRNLARKYKTRDQRRYKQTGSEQTYVSCSNFQVFSCITFNSNDVVFLGFCAVLPTENLSSWYMDI